MKNHLGTDQLRKGRISIPGARYFVTCCTEERKPGLDGNPLSEALLEALRTLHRDRDFVLHCAVIMPDHIHSLFTLGQKLTLSQTQGKFKSRTNDPLKKQGLLWQENFYDHRIRTDAYLEPFARYCFLNPYRRGLITTNTIWPGWILNKNYKPAFSEYLVDGSYPPFQWLGQSESIKDLIQKDVATELSQ